MSAPIIVWFRNDLRLRDNPALYQACLNKTPIIPVFIYDPSAMDRDYGGAQKWWLHHALKSLREDFKNHGVDLIIRKGDSLQTLNKLIEQTGAKAVYWNRSYESWSIDRDSHIKEVLKDRGLDAQSFKANVLFEPWTVKKGSGDPYRVFTPFWKACRAQEGLIGDELPLPDDMINGVSSNSSIGDISDLNLLPSIPWDQKMSTHWDISEKGAWARLDGFFKTALSGYKEDRNIPSQDTTSRLSPYLRWGMISPRSIWHATNLYSQSNTVPEKDKDHFLSEVGWREFSFHLLYYNPDMKDTPLQERFKNFPWEHDVEILKKWQKGQTGYPLIDAGMRQLWETGWMHNRVRMIVGSLLVKHLLHSWVEGEKWFWDTLVDACPANNVAGWQWIGGCGADAAPYFRVFNPITQGDKFDAYNYVRQYVPELKNVPDEHLFSPWEMDTPPADYPAPIIDHTAGREKALAAFEKTKVV